jgi:hypothetical protein
LRRFGALSLRSCCRCDASNRTLDSKLRMRVPEHRCHLRTHRHCSRISTRPHPRLRPCAMSTRGTKRLCRGRSFG